MGLRRVVGSTLPLGGCRRQSFNSRNPGGHAARQKQRQAMTALFPIPLNRFSSQRLVLLVQKTPIGDARGQTGGCVVASFFCAVPALEQGNEDER